MPECKICHEEYELGEHAHHIAAGRCSHGISELLTALERAGVDLMGLSCTIASITGVVPSSQLSGTIKAIQSCFEVPSVSKTDREYG